MVAERRPFGEACRAAGVLDIDRIVKLLLLLPLMKVFVADERTHSRQFVPGKHSGNFLRAQSSDRAVAYHLYR